MPAARRWPEQAVLGFGHPGKAELVRAQDDPRPGRPVEVRGPGETGGGVEVLRGLHVRLGAQPQPAEPALLGNLDDGEQQGPPGAAALRLSGDREGPDVRLGAVPGKFAIRAERLERDRTEDALVVLGESYQDGAVVE